MDSRPERETGYPEVETLLRNIDSSEVRSENQREPMEVNLETQRDTAISDSEKDIPKILSDRPEVMEPQLEIQLCVKLHQKMINTIQIIYLDVLQE